MDRDNLDWALHVYGKAPLAHPHDRPLALARNPAPSRPWTTAQIIRPQPSCSYIMKYFKTHICCHTSQMLSVHATHIISPQPLSVLVITQPIFLAQTSCREEIEKAPVFVPLPIYAISSLAKKVGGALERRLQFQYAFILSMSHSRKA